MTHRLRFGRVQTPLLLLIPFLLIASSVSAQSDDRYATLGTDPHRQFDFWVGEWDVNLRIIDDSLKFRDRVQANAYIYPILGGRAILELWDSDPVKGYSLRYYDPDENEWVLWLNWPGRNRSSTTRLTGSFRHGRGVFESAPLTGADGDTVYRYSFSDIRPISLRWDDLISEDGGRTWRENWRMEFRRTGMDPHLPTDSIHLPTYGSGTRCDLDEFRGYEKTVGTWIGAEEVSGKQLRVYRVLGGCAVMMFEGTEDNAAANRFIMLTYDTEASQWEASVLGNDSADGLYRFVSSESWNELRDGDHTLSIAVTTDELQIRLNGPLEVESAARYVPQNHIEDSRN